MEAGHSVIGVPETGSTSSSDVMIIGGHQWSGWPGAQCLRCGSEQVLELAVAENWIAFTENDDGSPGPEEWKSPDHEALVNLCDSYCYADMTPEQIEAHKVKIKELCVKIGWPVGQPKEPDLDVASVE